MRLMLFVILLLVFFSCGQKVIEQPDNLISKDKMTDILYDLAIINAAKSTSPKILEEHHIVPMEYLYDKHGVDSVQFVKSDIYYASLPTEYEAIYKKVESRLEKEKKDLEEATKQKNDSVRKVSEKKRNEGKKPNIRKIVQDTLP